MADSTNTNNDNATAAPEPAECTICTSVIGEPRDDGSVEAGITLPCTHFFGMRCLAHSILDRGTCPVCRAEIPRDIVHDLARVQRGLNGNATGDAPSEHQGADWNELDALEAARDAASFQRRRQREREDDSGDDDNSRAGSPVRGIFSRRGPSYDPPRSPSPRVWRERSDTSRRYGGARIIERYVDRDGRVGTRDVTFGDDEAGYRGDPPSGRRAVLERRPSTPSPRSGIFPSTVDDMYRERARRFREREHDGHGTRRESEQGRYEPRYVPDPAPYTPRAGERVLNPIPFRHVPAPSNRPRSPQSQGRRNALPSPSSPPRTSPPRRDSARPGTHRTARGTEIEEGTSRGLEERSVREQNEIRDARARYRREREAEEERRRRGGGGGGGGGSGGRSGRYDYWG